MAVTPFAVHPPRRGGQTRVAGLLGNLGDEWRIEQFSQLIQRTDLPWPPARLVVSPTLTEHRMRDPMSLAWMLGLAKLGYPQVYFNELLSLLPRRPLRRALAAASVVLVSHPYQVRWVRAAMPPSTPVVMDAPNVEAQLYPPRGTPFGGWLAGAVARSEREAWHLVDLAFACTESDADIMRDGGAPEVVVVPNAADLTKFRPADAADRLAKRRALGLPVDARLAVFVASAHPPNIEALETLEQQAAAYASESIQLVVVGRVASRSRRVANVIFAGEVADVVPWLGAADIAVNPMRSGGGSNLKMTEYLAAGLPVVTTEVGARGLALRSGLEAEVCDLDSMPAVAGGLFANPARLEAMAEQARRAAEDRFDWAASGKTAAGALGRLADRSRSRPG